jgi:adenosylcobinamide-phosphate synthase
VRLTPAWPSASLAPVFAARAPLHASPEGVALDPVLVPAVVALAALIDVAAGEPPAALHPVVWMGRLIAALERRRPRGRPRAELAYGVFLVLVVAGVCGAGAVALTLAFDHLPWWLAVPLSAAALKTTFSLRGLVAAARRVQAALAADTGAARAELAALVSRDRELDAPHIVSAAVESLAENLTDSVVSPLLYFALFGLPGAFVYRAANTMDAMVGYRGEYEYVGKAAARLDDVLNWLPARLTGVLIALLAPSARGRREARRCVRARPHPATGPNKLVTISAMAGALGAQLEKPGVYAVGPPEHPLEPALIGAAAAVVWRAGAAAVVLSAGLGALVTWLR